MRQIDFIVLHCTASPQTQTVESILNHWKNFLGWKVPGYHWLLKPDGGAVQLQDITKPTNGVAGFNAKSIHLSYIGGVDNNGRPTDNRTPGQVATMKEMVEELSFEFPNAIILGHRDFSPDKNRDGIIAPDEWVKACPSFSVKAWLEAIGFRSKKPPVYFRTRTTVNIRAGAGTLFPKLKTLRPGTTVKEIGSANGWTFVLLQDKTKGWISSAYLLKL